MGKSISNKSNIKIRRIIRELTVIFENNIGDLEEGGITFVGKQQTSYNISTGFESKLKPGFYKGGQAIEKSELLK